MSDTESPARTEFAVIGWKIDPLKGFVTVFESRKSPNPRIDVENALVLRPSLVEVRLDKNLDEWKAEFVRGYLAVGERDSLGRYIEHPLRNGALSYQVWGYVRTGKLHPVSGKPLQRILFNSEESVDPALDVERALKMGCILVTVAVNFEPTQRDKEREELEREKIQREEEEDRRFWDNIPEFSASE